MGTKGVIPIEEKSAKADGAKLLKQYGCGPIPLMGRDGLYDRHLLFDNIKDLAAIPARDRYEAFAHSVRDVLSQRWMVTEKTYERENPKRVYYVSMEFLLGRSAASNMTNLLLDSFVAQTAIQENIDLLSLLEQEPDAGLGNGGLSLIHI